MVRAFARLAVHRLLPIEGNRSHPGIATQETALSHTEERPGASRTTILVPERILPPEGSVQHRPWGALLAGPLVIIALGTVIASSLGMIAPGDSLPHLSRAGASAHARPPIAAPDVILPRSPLVVLPVPPRAESDDASAVAARSNSRVDPIAPISAVPMALSHADTSEHRHVPIARLTEGHIPVIAPVDAARRTSIATAVTPLSGPLANLVQPADYPPSARERGEQGDVTVRLVINPDGRVSNCLVLATDASETLSRATCRILATRARFAPTRDHIEAASFGEVTQHIAWRLP